MRAIYKSIFSLASLVLLCAGLFAQDNILDDSEGRKVKISMLEQYRERLAVFREEGETFREVVPNRQPLVARVDANLLDIDLSAIDESTEFSIEMGEFAFSATLGEDPRYKPGKKVATFALGAFVERPDGSERFLKVGSIKVTWTDTKLRVVIVCSDLALVDIGSIGASSYVELADPGKQVKGGGEPIGVRVAFGDLEGETECNAQVVSGTGLKRFGRPDSENYEEFLLSRVTLKAGTAVREQDPISPGTGGGGSDSRVSGGAIPQPGMLADLGGTIRGITGTTVTSIKVSGSPATAGEITIGLPDPDGVQIWSIVGVHLNSPKLNQIEVTFVGTDANGQPTTAVFRTTTFGLF